MKLLPFGIKRIFTGIIVLALILLAGLFFPILSAAANDATQLFNQASNPIRSLDYNTCKQNNITINPGNSGGPLFNSTITVSGVNAMNFKESKAIALAIPSDTVVKSMQDANVSVAIVDDPNVSSNENVIGVTIIAIFIAFLIILHRRKKDQIEPYSTYVSTNIEEKQIPITTPIIRRKWVIISGLLFILAISLVAGWYWYESIYNNDEVPEKIVENFYEAYFDHDFDVVAQNLSVFWSVRFLPDDYASMSPSQLMENRTEIEKEVAVVIADAEKDNQIPQGVIINIMNDYTKVGKYSAVVVYSFIENDKQISIEAAVLILEKGQFRIFNMSPVNDEQLDQIRSLDINILDKNFADLLGS